MKIKTGIARMRIAAALALPVMASLAFATAELKAAPTIIGNGSYQNQVNKTCLSTDATCDLSFTNVPNGKTLFINSVSCAFSMPTTAKIENVQLQRRVDGIGGMVGSHQHLSQIQAISIVGGKTNYL